MQRIPLIIATIMALSTAGCDQGENPLASGLPASAPRKKSFPNEIRATLPHGFEISIPGDWRIHAQDTRQLIEELNALPGKENSENVFAANSTSMPEYVSARVDVVTPPPLTPTDVQLAKPEELKALSLVAETYFRASMNLPNQEFLEYISTVKETIGGRPTLTCSYRRNSKHGPVLVSISSIYGTKVAIDLTLSYREAKANSLKPIVERIKSSVSFDAR